MRGQLILSVLLVWAFCPQGSQAIWKNITVNINEDQNHRSINVPHVCQLLLTASSCGPSCHWNWTTNGSSIVGCSGSPCVGPSCCLPLSGSSSLNISNHSTTASPFTLKIDVDTGKIGCNVYLFPMELSPPQKFQCIPAVSCDTSDADAAIIGGQTLHWMFSSSTSGPTIVSSFTDKRLVVSQYGVEIGSGATVQVAGSYVPWLNSTNLVAKQDIYRLQFVDLESPSVIHSFAVVQGHDTTLSCSVESEPNATTRWEFNPIDPRCNVSTLNQTGTQYSPHNFVFSYGTMHVEYCDAGIYTCNVSNGFKYVSTRLRLRVRDPLRPLWPAIGIIACLAVTAVFIIIGTRVDNVIAKRRAANTSNVASFRRSSSAADYNVATTPTGDAVRFRLGSKLTFEPSTLGSPT